MGEINQELCVAESRLAAVQARCQELEEALRVCNWRSAALEQQLRAARAELEYWRVRAEALQRELDEVRAQNTRLKWGLVGLLAWVFIGTLFMKRAPSGQARSVRR